MENEFLVVLGPLGHGSSRRSRSDQSKIAQRIIAENILVFGYRQSMPLCISMSNMEHTGDGRQQLATGRFVFVSKGCQRTCGGKPGETMRRLPESA